jgi:hypothetical protein
MPYRKGELMSLFADPVRGGRVVLAVWCFVAALIVLIGGFVTYRVYFHRPHSSTPEALVNSYLRAVCDDDYRTAAKYWSPSDYAKRVPAYLKKHWQDYHQRVCGKPWTLESTMNPDRPVGQVVVRIGAVAETYGVVSDREGNQGWVILTGPEAAEEFDEPSPFHDG